MCDVFVGREKQLAQLHHTRRAMFAVYGKALLYCALLVK